ncbi:transcriptional regulator [Thiotrichales bacterium 19S11-10]|nr:transcriptional regulator [Thiotrichales bacterium 19S11-10]
MYLKIGMSRQQYQQLELKGNPRLETLELVAQGLGGEILFIPKEKLAYVKAVLEIEKPRVLDSEEEMEGFTIDDPWKDILKEEDD